MSVTTERKSHFKFVFEERVPPKFHRRTKVNENKGSVLGKLSLWINFF